MGSCFGLGRWKRQRYSIRTWPSVALCSSPTPTGEENDAPQPTGRNTDNLREDGDDYLFLDFVRNDEASQNNGASRTGGRVAGRVSTPQNPRFDQDGLPTTSTKVSSGSGMTDGRLRLKWGIDLDIQVTI